MIEFKNGSVIKTIKTDSESIRGNRSKVMSFYCTECQCWHENYKIIDVIWVDKGILICKESLERKGIR